MTDKRVLLINADGTAEVNGVRVRVVPKEPTEAMQDAMRNASAEYPYKPFQDGSKLGYMQTSILYRAMLSAATLDLSSLPRGPTTTGFDGPFAAGMQYALDAMGVK